MSHNPSPVVPLLLAALVVLAGCSGLGVTDGDGAAGTPVPSATAGSGADPGDESQAEPDDATGSADVRVTDAGLLGDPGTVEDLSRNVSTVSFEDDAVVGAEVQLPVQDGEFAATVEVTIYDGDERVAHGSQSVTGSADHAGDSVTRDVWLVFDTEDWEDGTHTAKVTLTGTRTGETGGPVRFAFDFDRPYTDAELERLDTYDAWGADLANEFERRGLNATNRESDIDEDGEWVAVTVRLEEQQRLQPAAAETANAVATTVTEAREEVAADRLTEPSFVEVVIRDADGELFATYRVEPRLAHEYLTMNATRETYAGETVGDLRRFQFHDDPVAPPKDYLRAAELRQFVEAYEALLVANETGGLIVNDTYVDVDNEEVKVHVSVPADPGILPSRALHTNYWRSMLVTRERYHPGEGAAYYITDPKNRVPDARGYATTEGAYKVMNTSGNDRLQASFDYSNNMREYFQELEKNDVSTEEPTENPFASDELSLQVVPALISNHTTS